MDRHHMPVALVLTRQDVPIIDRSRYASADGLRRGAYVLADPEDGDPEVILIATGSEVALALEAHEKLVSDGVRSRVVSLPCWELFERQEQSYQDEVLPPGDPGEGLGRGGLYAGLGPVRRSRGSEDRDAHLRLLRTPEGRTEQVRVHPGQGGRDSQGGTWTMKPTEQLHELGQSLWLDNITRTMLDDGTEQRYIDELSITGQTSNPTIFDKAISSAGRLRRADRRASRKGHGAGGALLRARPRRRHARGQDVRRDPQGDRPDGRLGLPRGLAAVRLRHAGDDSAGGRPVRASGGEQLHQDPRDARGSAGDRGVDLRRRADQRHAVVLDAIRRSPRQTPT